MGNGDTSLGLFRHFFPERWLTYDPTSGENACLDLRLFPPYRKVLVYLLVAGALLAIVGNSLLPLILPAKGQRQAAFLTGSLSRLAVGGLLCGFPLAALYLLASENISGQANPGSVVRVEESEDSSGEPKLKGFRLVPYPLGNRRDPELGGIERTFDRRLSPQWPASREF
jgi:hypothetical protein